MEFKFEPFHRDIPDEELISDLVRLKTKLNKDKLTKADYKNHGKYSTGTFERRFGSWNKALKKAGILLSTQFDISDEELFKNIEDVWIKLGRQPKYAEFRYPLSKFSVAPYQNRFGGWNNALKKFIDYINLETDEEQSSEMEKFKEKETNREEIKHKTKREISDRLRFKILMRDGFTCRSCGRSPVKELGVELHVDHIIPWSKGGETVPENLETKCKKCNLGKGNAFNV